MSRDTFVQSGLVHTTKDKNVSGHELQVAQNELNGHTSMLIKIFKIGTSWGQADRIR